MSNIQDIDIEIEYQYFCLDVLDIRAPIEVECQMLFGWYKSDELQFFETLIIVRLTVKI